MGSSKECTLPEPPTFQWDVDSSALSTTEHFPPVRNYICTNPQPAIATPKHTHLTRDTIFYLRNLSHKTKNPYIPALSLISKLDNYKEYLLFKINQPKTPVKIHHTSQALMKEDHRDDFCFTIVRHILTCFQAAILVPKRHMILLGY